MSSTRRHCREIILARRALFLASAFGGLSLAPTAEAQQPPPPPADDEEPTAPGEPLPGEPLRVEPPGDEAAAERSPTAGEWQPLVMVSSSCVDGRAAPPRLRGKAQVLQRKALEHYRQGDMNEALAALREARELLPLPMLHYQIGKIAHAQGSLAEARGAFELYLECGADDPDDFRRAEVERQLEKLRAITGRLRLELGTRGSTVHIDGQLAATLPRLEHVVVMAGSHSVELRSPDGGLLLSGQIYLEGGEDMVLTVARLRQTSMQPCLSICLSPCLSIEPGHVRQGLHLGLGVAPHLAVATEDGGVRGGGGAALWLNLGLTRTFDFRLGLFGVPTGGAGGFAVLAGGSTDGYLAFGEHFAVGTGLGAGYLGPFEQSKNAREREAGVFEPGSSFFLQPHLSPALVRLGGFEVELQGSAVLAESSDGDESRFGLSYVTGTMWLSYLFLDTEDYD